jgi:nicotinamidase-related amidase
MPFERLVPSKTALVVVDLQERLVPAMPTARIDALLSATKLLLEAAVTLGVPVIVTEQYPRGLGPTCAIVDETLQHVRHTRIAKSSFDACLEPTFADALLIADVESAVVVGVEAHICVLQTARSLLERGYGTHIVADAVASRREENRTIGLELARSAGAFITSAETVVYDWIGRAGTEAFRALAPLLR